VTVDGSGNIYIADYSESTIRKVNTNGIISTIAGTGIYGYSGDGGVAIAAQISDPTGIAVDASNNVYFWDCANNRIRKVAVNGTITTIVGNGIAGSSGDGGPATSAEIYGGGSLSIDGSGNIYFSDGDNYRVRFVTSGGIIFTIAGTGVQGYSGDGGPATSAKISISGGIVADASGNAYFTDATNERVRKLSK
jgi:sugar lactone lactonase YvrE